MSKQQHINLIADQLKLPTKKVAGTLSLLDGGATIPFIARYRKEATGSLDETQIAAIEKEGRRLADLEKRRETILQTIEDQGKLTDNLKKRILNCYDATELEDIYLPYKPKRRTRGTMAKEKGLEPLAEILFQQEKQNVEQLAQSFLNDEVADTEEALQGARDIMAEWINEDEKARNKVRRSFAREAMITCKVARGKEEEGAKYRDYFDYQEPLKKCPSHRMLAIRRGESEGILRVIIEPEEEQSLYGLEKLFLKGYGPATQQVKTAIADAYKRLLAPSIETEFRQSSKSEADQEAIEVFALNLRQLLLSAPLGQKRVLGIDPGFRTGCKVVCLDDSGDLLQNDTIYPHPPQSDEYGACRTLEQLVNRFQIDAIAIGNGTAGRETMALCQKIDFGKRVEVFLVNEAGASIYSASDVAREEFPDKDITVRGAVSIGRRLMDPLAELVKIDPKSIGVGQYQHDVNQPQLRESLTQVVESCVNSIGININTASKHLLTYVSGLGPTLAQNIVEYRTQNGAFQSRKALLKVARMGEKAYEQSAGFLRIREGKNPLDNTAVHPESYPIVEQMAKDLGVTVQRLIDDAQLRKSVNLNRYTTETVGLPTLKDIMKELEKPGLDPRGEAKSFQFANIKTIDDLNEGMVVPGIVNNITNFGAFVDIGIKESGLVHISQLANRFVKNPAEVVSLNQEVQVRVMEIDRKRGRIQLSMKDV
ncbi:Tex family protein [Flavilitoribacter nigricans]|uniref:RNA-binding transcriptional accessory protein n=1 Tax=Flavilitoribacter nigricans (strain ATCC 23147 / DSM 23189 / NBRC 102662 / NCIMB 1420 / SS-2) TaxID=1122177 RepID=A0A2D0NDF4_FLAN2|nr:Tex family protein [Flavilitoribacter nigricans]PHN06209.1 RNA-binding transcriptional accessory protein [Flavilitoribacter nigricans DSM 23189 = NBRC 102662]